MCMWMPAEEVWEVVRFISIDDEKRISIRPLLQEYNGR